MSPVRKPIRTKAHILIIPIIVLTVATAGCPIVQDPPFPRWVFLRETPEARPIAGLNVWPAAEAEIVGIVVDRNDDGVWDYYVHFGFESDDPLECLVDEDFDGWYDVCTYVTRGGKVLEVQRRADAEVWFFPAGGDAYGEPSPFRREGKPWEHKPR